MSRLEDLLNIEKIVTNVQSLTNTKKRDLFRKHSDQKRLYYRHYRELETIQQNIAFEKAWRGLLDTQKEAFAVMLVSKRYPFALRLIEDAIDGQFTARRADVTKYLAEMFSGEKNKRHRVESKPDDNVEPLHLLQRQNPLMERFQSHLNLDHFDIEQTIGLGYLNPYPNVDHDGHPGRLRFRMDILVLTGPWTDILLTSEHQRYIQQQVAFQIGDHYEERYRLMASGSSQTHRTGLIVLQMTPCFYAHDHTDGELLFPYHRNQTWSPDKSFNREDLRKQMEEIDIGLLESPAEEIPESSPFHPSNLKQTIERKFEYIFSSQHRIAFWSSLNALSSDVINPYLRINEYIKRYANLYKFKAPKPPTREIQSYLQNHYKQTPIGLRNTPSADTQNMFKNYTRLGFNSKSILLSPFFVFETTKDLDFQIANALVNPMVQIVNYQRELYKHLFKPDDIGIRLIQQSINHRAFPQSWNAHKTCFARLRFKILDETYKNELSDDGATFIFENDSTYVDVYGFFRNFHPHETLGRRLAWEGLVQAALPRDTVHKALLSNIEHEIEYDFSQILPLCNWDETSHFSTIQLNAAYWSEEEQSQLWTQEKIHEYLKSLGK